MKKKILIIGPENVITIIRNTEMLNRHFYVRLIRFSVGNWIRQSIDIIKTLRGVWWSDITLSHFATMHAFWTVLFSRLLRKKSIVIVAGFEAAQVVELSYGAMLSPVKARIVRLILKHADKIFAVSEFTRNEILSNVLHRKDVSVVYGCNAIDSEHFSPNGEKDELVLTVGFIDKSNIMRKGFKTFLKTAEYLPDIKFVLLGKHAGDLDGYMEKGLPSNVIIEDDSEMLRWYQRAKVYCQLSYYESFGVCLIEAMCCGCVPVVTDRGALPEVAGEIGLYVPYGDPEKTADAIRKALASGSGDAARERAKNCFSIEVKREEFINEIENVYFQ